MALKDMARIEEDKDISPLTSVSDDIYPYGLRISLTEAELEKLGVDHSDWEIGDTFHLHGLAKVVSISQNASEDHESVCVSLQFTHLAGPESEDEEDAEEEAEDDEPSLEKHGYLRHK